MHRSELWLVQENHATVKLDSIVASPGMKTYSKSGRMELRNLQILKKMFEKPCQFLSSKQPCEPKTLDVALIVAGDQNTLKKNAVAVNTGGHLIQIFTETSFSDGGNLWPLWLVIVKSVWFSVEDTL